MVLPVVELHARPKVERVGQPVRTLLELFGEARDDLVNSCRWSRSRRGHSAARGRSRPCRSDGCRGSASSPSAPRSACPPSSARLRPSSGDGHQAAVECSASAAVVARVRNSLRFIVCTPSLGIRSLLRVQLSCRSRPDRSCGNPGRASATSSSFSSAMPRLSIGPSSKSRPQSEMP